MSRLTRPAAESTSRVCTSNSSSSAVHTSTKPVLTAAAADCFASPETAAAVAATLPTQRKTVRTVFCGRLWWRAAAVPS